MSNTPLKKLAHLSYVAPLVVALFFAQFQTLILDSDTITLRALMALGLMLILLGGGLASALFLIFRGEASFKKPAWIGVLATLAVFFYIGPSMISHFLF